MGLILVFATGMKVGHQIPLSQAFGSPSQTATSLPTSLSSSQKRSSGVSTGSTTPSSVTATPHPSNGTASKTAAGSGSPLNILPTDASALSRVQLWETGVRMTLAHPLTGVGLGNSVALFPKYVRGNLLISTPYFLNIFVQVAAETGVIGLILFCAFFIRLGLDTLPQVRRSPLSAALLAGIIAFLVQNLAVEYMTATDFWVLVGLLLALIRMERAGGPTRG